MIRSLMVFGLVAVAAVVAAPQLASAGHHAAACCAPEPVCCVPVPVCPPPPVEVCVTVCDPCTGCSYQVSTCVPACCAMEAPCMTGWKKGIFGRKVLTYKWSCGHCIDVVITKHGKTIVRD